MDYAINIITDSLQLLTFGNLITQGQNGLFYDRGDVDTLKMNHF